MAVFIQGPGQKIIGIDIMPYLELFSGQGQAFRKFHVLIHLKCGKLSIVQDLIERGQMANVFH